MRPTEKDSFRRWWKTATDESPRGGPSTAPARAVVLIVCGLFFGIAFSTFALDALGIIHLPFGHYLVKDRRPVGYLVGIFGLLGWLVVYAGINGLVQRARYRRRLAEHPQQPWLADHGWDPEQSTSESRRRTLSGLPAVLMLVILFLFCWSDKDPAKGWTLRDVPVLVLAAGVIMLFYVGRSAYFLWQGFKYGQSRLAFAQFPYFLGGPLNADLSHSRTIRRCRRLAVVLRCIQEGVETHGKNSSVVRREVYKDVQQIEVGGVDLTPDQQISIGFPLPTGEYATALCQEWPRYWELAVRADTPGVDYEALFLLPVYGRPPSAQHSDGDHQTEAPIGVPEDTARNLADSQH